MKNRVYSGLFLLVFVMACGALPAITPTPAASPIPTPRPTMTPPGGGAGWITFAGGGGFWRVSSDGAVCEPLLRGSYLGIQSWSPDGTKLAYEQNDRIMVMNSDGSGVENLTAGLIFRADAPAWSPDGRTILFQAEGLRDVDLYLVDVHSKRLKQLTNIVGETDLGMWSPDGRRIAFGSRQDGNYDIYLIGADGTGLVNLTNSPDVGEGLQGWSPDGARLAYNARVGVNNYDIFVMNADGTGTKDITNDPGVDDFDTVWSPDGKRLAYSYESEIYTVGFDGSGKVNLTEGLDGGKFQPVWSPDGTEIAFKWHDGIASVRRDGSNARLLSGQCAIRGQLTDKRPIWQPLAPGNHGEAGMVYPTAPAETPTPIDARYGVWAGKGGGYTYQVLFDKSLWELKPGPGQIPWLVHRTIKDCLVLRAEGREVPTGLTLEKGGTTLGDVRYETASVSKDGKLSFRDYWSSLFDEYGGLVGYQVNTQACIQPAEVVLATLQVVDVGTPTP